MKQTDSSWKALVAGNDDLSGAEAQVEALQLMEQALALLDSADVPADIGASLDHAMHKLTNHLRGCLSAASGR